MVHPIVFEHITLVSIMAKQDLIISKLEGYSGIRLQNNKPLHIKPGINLLIGRNGSGKTNLIQLVNTLANDKPAINQKIESSFFKRHAEKALQKKGNSITKRFGLIEVVKFSHNETLGYISISIKDINEDYVLRNIIEPGAEHYHQITTVKKGPEIRFQLLHSGNSTLKLDFGGSIHTNVLSTNQDKDLSSLIEEPIGMINEFVYNRFLDFFNSPEFEEKVRYLERLLNEKLQAFFGTTNKKILLSKSSRHYLNIKPILIDGENEIQPEYISAGERALLDLIFNLASVDIDKFDILAFDEPEIHMHDDMISVFVNEIIQLSDRKPNCKILIASHSTSLIEKFSYFGTKKTSLIIFNEKREVTNSTKDIDLINALNRNGVWFSPLMLSKRHNLYIENQGKGESSHKDFYLKFFDPNNKPNVIPIGSGASVEQSQSFSETLQELIKSSDIKSKGIRDGDVWVRELLNTYLSGQIELNEFIEKLSQSENLYIKVNKKKKGERPDYYFNFWEIENLYLMPELLGCWKRKKKILTQNEYYKLLGKSKQVYTEEYLELFFKSLYPRPNKQHNLQKKIEAINQKLFDAQNIAEKESEINKCAALLVEKLITMNLTQWLPGKEIKKFLESNDYSFDESGYDFESLELSSRIRKILQL